MHYLLAMKWPSLSGLFVQTSRCWRPVKRRPLTLLSSRFCCSGPERDTFPMRVPCLASGKIAPKARYSLSSASVQIQRFRKLLKAATCCFNTYLPHSCTASSFRTDRLSYPCTSCYCHETEYRCATLTCMLHVVHSPFITLPPAVRVHPCSHRFSPVTPP